MRAREDSSNHRRLRPPRPLRSMLSSITLLAACTSPGGMATRSPAPPPAPMVASEADMRGAGDEFATAAQQRLLVRRATVAIEVDDVAPVAGRAAAVVTQLGGYVQSTQTSERSLYMVVRVPAPVLDAAADSLGKLGTVTSRGASGTDVTEQVMDADARLRSLVAVRDRLRQHLERAQSVADVVAVERELTRVQSEIDVLEGRLKRLRTDVALSELTLSASQRVVLGPLGALFAGLGKAIGKLFVWR